MRIFGSAERTSSNPMGKVAKTFVAAALALGMTFSVGIQALTPEKAYAYGYTVRISSGDLGTFANGDTLAVINDLPYGKVGINFAQNNVHVDDNSKYYAKGWKLAGKDDVTKNAQNNDSLLLSSLTVTGDMDLVVCYGVLVDAVNYTVRYVDQAGNELLPTETFRGNVGDSPVLAYHYIEGYLPQAYNLTGELYRNEAENVYTFTYTAIIPPEDVTVTLPTVVTPAPAAAAAGAGEEAPAAAEPEPFTPEDAPAQAVEEPQDEEFIAEDGTPLAQPADVEDIRDEETPMASLNSLARGDSMSEDADLPLGEFPFLIGLGIGAFAVAAVVVAFLLVQRKKQRETLVNAARASIAAGNTVDPASLQDDDVNINFVPLNNQANYANPAQMQYGQQPVNSQQYYAAPDYAQQYPAQYGTQQYGDMQYGGQVDGQYGQNDQYNPQLGTQDDQ